MICLELLSPCDVLENHPFETVFLSGGFCVACVSEGSRHRNTACSACVRPGVCTSWNGILRLIRLPALHSG
jgi:hypothetical protein